MSTVEKIKTDLRITHNFMDGDIADQIEECLKDLEICGIVEPDPDDPAILSAVKLWVRAHYISDIAKSQAYQEKYDQKKACLMTAEGYGGSSVTGGGA